MSLLMTSFRATLFFLIVCGLLYPLATTGLARLLFPFQAGGEIVTDGSSAPPGPSSDLKGRTPCLFS